MNEVNVYNEFSKRGLLFHVERFIEFMAFENPQNITSSRVFLVVKKESDITNFVDAYFDSKYLLVEDK